MDNLIPNKSYQFRILAENTFGCGEPSEPTKTIQTSGSNKTKSFINLGVTINFNLESDAQYKRHLGKYDDLLRRKNKDLPRLDNYDRCCT